MNKRSLLLFPTALLLSPLFAADPVRNPDVIAQGAGGTWTTTTTGGGSTSYVPPTTIPKGPEIAPQYGTNAPETGGNSSSFGGGLLGFLFNLGKKSAKEIESERVREGIDKALSKAQSGIPLDSADYAALGSADLSKPSQVIPSADKTGWTQRMQRHKDLVAQAREKAAAVKAVPVVASVPAPVVTTAAPLEAIKTISPTGFPDVKLPTTLSPAIGKFGITCKAPIPMDSGDLTSAITKVPSLAEKMQAVRKVADPTLLKDNPFKGLADAGNGIGGGMTLIGGAGALAAKTTATGTVATGVAAGTGGTATVTVVGGAGAGTAAGGTAAGGTVAAGTAAGGTATTTTIGGAIVAAAPYVAAGAAAAGVVAGIWAVLDYVHPNENNVFFKKRYQAKLRNQAIKNPSQVGGSGGSSSPNPKKPDEEKEKRAQQIREHRRWTNKEAREQAKALNKGYVEKKNKPETIRDIGFTNGKEWISPDMDGHNGGVWKLFNLKGDRIATLDKNLNRIKN